MDYKSKLKVANIVSIAFFIAGLLAIASYGLYNDFVVKAGPYRVTLYTGDGQPKVWTTEDKPEAAPMGSGFEIKTHDGKIVTISGNVVIEQIPKEIRN